MFIGWVMVLGAFAGLASISFRGSGYGLWWGVALGVAGSAVSGFIVTGAYFMNGVGEADAIGLNWYTMAAGVVGALIMIFGAKLYKRAAVIS